MDNKICEKTYKEIDESIVKVELMEPEQSSENINLNFVEVPSGGYHSNVKAISRRRRRRCRRLQSPALPKHNLKEKRLRPIRPKPLQPTSLLLKHRFECLPMMNMTTLPSNRVFVPNAVSIKENIQYVTPTTVSNEMNSYIGLNNSNNTNNINNSNVDSNINLVNTINDSDNSNIVNIQPVTEENKIDETVETQNSTTVNSNCNDNSDSSNTNNNSNISSNSNCNKYLHNKETSKSYKNSIELFFESMAQTVLNLPNEVQADIKMKICKIVTEAEIQYCHKSQAKSKD